jgi:hypothetical protein
MDQFTATAAAILRQHPDPVLRDMSSAVTAEDDPGVALIIDLATDYARHQIAQTAHRLDEDGQQDVLASVQDALAMLTHPDHNKICTTLLCYAAVWLYPDEPLWWDMVLTAVEAARRPRADRRRNCPSWTGPAHR